MLIYQQPPHIYKAKNFPSSGNKSSSAACGGYSEMIYCAAVDKIEEKRKPEDFSGHRKRDKLFCGTQSAACGGYSEMIYCAAVDKIEEKRKPEDFSGHRKRERL